LNKQSILAGGMLSAACTGELIAADKLKNTTRIIKLKVLGKKDLSLC
jgi:hypothetical protein